MRPRGGWWRTIPSCQKRKSVRELKAQAEQELADQKAAEAVEGKIEAIGEVEYTEASKAKIEEAREAYQALSGVQKKLVKNYSMLTQAEERYKELKTQAEQTLADQKAAEAVEGKIEAIGEVEYTQASKAKIEEAREAFESLSDVQKELVENYSTLVEAEVRYQQYVNDEKRRTGKRQLPYRNVFLQSELWNTRRRARAGSMQPAHSTMT